MPDDAAPETPRPTRRESYLHARWRPICAWMAVIALGLDWFGPWIVTFVSVIGALFGISIPAPPIPVMGEAKWAAIAALLGLGSLRTVDKINGQAKS